ncbi:MAG: hypothetical protein WB818_14080 [Desulfobacterales bacterium]
MMRKTNAIIVVLAFALALAPAALATNGDALIGVGPISRAMGGAGVAAPQDAISAIFANPAAMSAPSAPDRPSISRAPFLCRRSKAM